MAANTNLTFGVGAPPTVSHVLRGRAVAVAAAGRPLGVVEYGMGVAVKGSIE